MTNPNQCQAAIMAVFPKELWPEAFKVTHLEDGTANPHRIGPPNKDQWHSRDYGCFQINDHYQYKNPSSGWTDFGSIFNADTNTSVAYAVYKANGSTWGPWSSVCLRHHEKLPLARCGRK